MASKQYISIIRLFEYCDIATVPDFDLPRTKKQLQAEFNIATGELIETGGFIYSRHDVFEEIERPDFLIRLNFHKQLWNSPMILQMLEKNSADPALLAEEFNQFWSNKTFDDFFSPYFAGPFSHITRTLLASVDFEKTAELFAFDGFLLAAEREEAFRPVHSFFEESLKLMRNISGDNYSIMRPKIEPWIDTTWHNFFNALPDEFYDAKIEIIRKLMNIGVAVQKTYRRDCRKVSEQFVLIDNLPQDLALTIHSNHKILSRSRFRLKFSPIFWIFWLVIGLGRLGTTSGCNNYDSGEIIRNGQPSIKFDTLVVRPHKDSSIRLSDSNRDPLHIKLK